MPRLRRQRRPHKAAGARSFLDSLGVNIHLRYSATRYADPTAVVNALKTLGVTHVRENFAPGSRREAAGVAELGAAGVRFDFVMPRPHEPGGGTVAESVNEVAQKYAAATELVEGANEYDGARRSDWSAALRVQQPGIAQAVAASGLRGVPVVGPSLINWKLKADAPLLGNLGASVDVGNIHSYPGGRRPELGIDDPVGGLRPGSAAVSGSSRPRPAITTPRRTRTDPLTRRPRSAPRRCTTRGCSWSTSGEVSPVRTPTSCFDEGTSTDQEDHFGLFRADGTPKGAALAIGNLTSILADTGTPRTDDLSYAITDTADTAVAGKLSSVLLEKSDGSFYLALWRQVSESDPGFGSSAPTDVTPQAAPVTVALGESTAGAQAYLPSIGPDPIDSWPAPNSLSVPVGGDVTLLRIVPTTSAANPTGAAVTPLASSAGAASTGAASTGAASTGAASTGAEAPDPVTPGVGTGSQSGLAPSPTVDATGGPTAGTPSSFPPYAASAGPAPDTSTGAGPAGDAAAGPPTGSDGAGGGSVFVRSGTDSGQLADALPALALPIPGQRAPTIKLSGQARRLVAPPTAVALSSVSFRIDGIACRDGVLDPAALKSGVHTVAMVGQLPDGRLVSSEQAVRTARATSSDPTLLVVALLLSLLALRLGGALWTARRRRRTDPERAPIRPV